MAQIFAIGSNGNGQLGIGHKHDVSVPRQVHIDLSPKAQPVAITAGGNHTLILTSDGQLYSSGDASSGARGLTPADGFTEGEFARVSFSTSDEPPPFVTHCAATWEASIIAAKDADGRSTRLFTFGTGNKGELGQGQLIFRSARPELVKNFPPSGTEIVALNAGTMHVVAVLDNGDVYGWGNGRQGQLGESTPIVYEPRKLGQGTRALCGRKFTFLASDSTSESYTLLGSDTSDISTGLPPSIAGWQDIGASWRGVTVLMSDGTVVSGGKNDHGQLAPSALPKLVKIAVGSEHTLALTEDGEVLAWGWGEHGNCGPKTVEGDVREPNVIASPKYLPEGTTISHIACGAATSFICLAPAQ